MSVVVCSRDRPKLLADCLPAVLAALRPGDDLLVVDSASRTDATARAAAAAGVRSVRAELPGASRARNVGVAATTAPVVAFTDDDCRPQPGWLAALAAGFTDPGVGFVCGRVVGTGAGAPTSVSAVDLRPRRVRAGDDLAEIGHGANLAVRRAAWAPLGGFDPLLGAGARFAGAEDKDAFDRLLAAGWTGLVAPDAVVGHALWRGRAGAVRASYGYGRGEGARAAKRRRLDGAGRLFAPALDGGLRPALADLRAGYRTGAVLGVVRAGGAALGAVQAWRLPLAGPVFADRPAR